RLWGIAAVFNWTVAAVLWPYLIGLSILTMVIAAFYFRMDRSHLKDHQVEAGVDNPLELKVAFIFAGLFVIMTILTQFVTHYFGDSGLKYLSALVGFTDIDPFVLSLLNGDYLANANVLAGAILIAAGSNNLLKAVYAFVLSEPKTARFSAGWLSALGLLTITLGWLFI
ncbi:MAG: DUF4010 domain-containing protein, partial [Hydrogenovibrio sp.]|nr:DUF4010 domain-containing protein [Hydrogenovibrio sp.]